MKNETKLFGVRIPLSRNMLAIVLFALVLGFGWYTFSGSSDDHPATTAPRPTVKPATAATVGERAATARRDNADRGKPGQLRLRPVADPTKVDPTLKTWLLDRVRAVPAIDGVRNLFDAAPMVIASNLPKVPKVAPMPPRPIATMMPPAAPAAPPVVVVNIPLRYYGFVKPTSRGDGNRGYFMAGDNILMATEGDLLEGHFLVVALSPNTARIEDIQVKQRQDLQLIPEAISQ